jgi:nucleoside-diphosphate-sugar epimerase
MTNKTSILVTGGAGLIGTALVKRLSELGHGVQVADVRVSPGAVGYGDVQDPLRLAKLAIGCGGIVHLAAVSRVVWGQNDPELCTQINVRGTNNVLRVALAARPRPWVLLASSREVYGEPRALPVDESHPLEPINVYGRSKLEAERLVEQARGQGLRTAIARFSNVFGSIDDHPDRVVPAFARAAALSEPLTVNGWNHTFDFTPLEDTVDGIVRLIEALESERAALPPIQFVTGRATTLGDLAELAGRVANRPIAIGRGPERTYDVAHFIGDPRRAHEVLGWRSTTDIATVLGRMIAGYRQRQASNG